MEKYPRGRRGAPAKGVVRDTVARVQIPLSPPLGNNTNVEDNSTFVFLIYTDFFAILRKIEEN